MFHPASRLLLRFFWIVCGVFALFFLIFIARRLTVPPPVPPPLSSYATTTATISGKTFSVYVADTEPKRVQGLSDLDPLRDDQGMFFIFDKPDRYGIWMKDMHFSIDIMWFDANGSLVYAVQEASPDSYPAVFSPDGPALTVLEVNAGFIAAHHTKIGDKLTVGQIAR